MNSGIYAITNAANNKTYVGSTQNFERRWEEHRMELNKCIHHNPYLQHSWDKYGDEAFEFMICEHVEDCEQLIDHEQSWLDFYRMNVGVYNMLLTVSRSNGFLGHKHTEETKQIISEKLKEVPHAPVSQEIRDKISETKRNTPPSEEFICRMSEVHTGNQYTLGRKHTEEEKESISRSMEGNKNCVGRVVSEETRHKLSIAAKAYWAAQSP